MKHPLLVKQQAQRRKLNRVQRQLGRLYLRAMFVWGTVYALAGLALLPPLNPLTHLAMFASVAGLLLAVCQFLARRKTANEGRESI